MENYFVVLVIDPLCPGCKGLGVGGENYFRKYFDVFFFCKIFFWLKIISLRNCSVCGKYLDKKYFIFDHLFLFQLNIFKEV